MSLDLPSFYQISDPSAPGVADFLSQLRKYDPSANYVAGPQSTSSEGVTNGTVYNLSFDPSKLPGLDGSGKLSDMTSSIGVPGQSAGFAPNFVPVNDSNKPISQTGITHSPIYGDVQNRSNVIVPHDHSWLDYSPLLVAGFGGLLGGFGAAAAGALGGSDAAAGAGAGGFDFGAGAAGTDLGAAAPGFDFGAGASGADLGAGIPGEAAGAGTGSFDYGAGAAGTDLGNTGGLTQAQWDEIISGQPENGSFVGPNGTDPNGFTPADYADLNRFNAGLDNPSLTDRLSNLLKDPGSLLQKLPGLLGGGSGTGTGSGGGGGGGNLLVNAGQQQKPQVEDAAAILARLYGPQRGLLGAR